MRNYVETRFLKKRNPEKDKSLKEEFETSAYLFRSLITKVDPYSTRNFINAWQLYGRIAWADEQLHREIPENKRYPAKSIIELVNKVATNDPKEAGKSIEIGNEIKEELGIFERTTYNTYPQGNVGQLLQGLTENNLSRAVGFCKVMEKRLQDANYLKSISWMRKLIGILRYINY